MRSRKFEHNNHESKSKKNRVPRILSRDPKVTASLKPTTMTMMTGESNMEDDNSSTDDEVDNHGIMNVRWNDLSAPMSDDEDKRQLGPRWCAM